jgi:NMD protein affecting ribosome stability and mRNA decay
MLKCSSCGKEVKKIYFHILCWECYILTKKDIKKSNMWKK